LLQSGSTNQFQGTPDVALDASGRLIVNAIGPVGKSAMWINFQNTPSGTWYGWVLLQPNGQFTTASTVPSMERLSASLAAYLASLGSNAGVVVEDVTHQQTYTYNSTSQFLTASSIKVPIMLTFFAQIESQGRGPTSNEMNLLTTMIENSNNNSASALFSEIGGASGISRFLQQIGVSGLIPDNNAWGYSEITPQAMVDLLTRLQAGTILTAPDRTTALSLMEQVETDQRWGAGDTAPSGATVAMKNGWVPGPDNLWSVNSSGIIITGAETYIISVYTQEQQSLADGQAIVQRVCGDVAAVLK
jgi:beta-lactamase class A